MRRSPSASLVPLVSLHLAVALGLLVAVGCRGGGEVVPGPPAREPVVGPCEGCEAVFEGMPAVLDWSGRIAPEGEPGEPLVVEGTVFGDDGAPAAGTIVYAYHTDARGLYPPGEGPPGSAAVLHGRLRGWVRADASGRYRFETMRPAGYPDSDLPQHVHMHVIEPGCCTYYIDDVVFDDDPRLTPRKREELVTGRAGSGLTSPQRDDRGRWRVTRDIHLGVAIPGHPRAAR